MMMKRRTTILLALICCVSVACSRGDEIEVESDSPSLDELDAEYDDDELDGVDYGVEELIFESPQDIEDLTKTALKEFALKVRTAEGMKGPGGYGTVCSKDEHCEDHEKCSKNGRCKLHYLCLRQRQAFLIHPASHLETQSLTFHRSW